MGLDNNGIKFLCAAYAAGVSFRKTAMLGRQNFFPDANALQSLLDSRQPGLSALQFLGDSQGYAEKFFAFLGGEEVLAIDYSDFEGAAIVADLNAPLDARLKSRFTAVFDGGCLEHIFNFPQAIANCMEMVQVGGHFLGITPANNFCGHGFYQFSPELYFRIFSESNGFKIRSILTKEKDTWFRITDPEEFGGRVEMHNNRAATLFVLAEKIEACQIFARSPAQSDYARRWEANPGSNEQKPANSQSFTEKLRTLLPRRLKEALRPFAANVSIRHRYPCYQRISEAALLRGNLNLNYSGRQGRPPN